MGFFGGGGSQTVNIPATGFYAQPDAYRNLYKGVLGDANDLFGRNSTVDTTAMFTPMGLNAGEQSGLNSIYQGFTPTSESLGQDLSMLMNPFDDYVINDINRQATGNNSLVNQAATRAGQQGSNRSFLGTSDVEQNRLNSIGQFRQGQYNTAVNQVLNNLVPQRSADAYGALTAGTYERDLSNQTKQAPYTALMAGQQALAGIPTQFGDFGSEAQQIKVGGGGGGLGGLLGGIGQIASVGSSLFGGGGIGSILGGLNQGVGSLMSSSPMGPYQGFFSDERLKENIEFVGEENGYDLYQFNYIGMPEHRFEGVIAQQVEMVCPEAVFESEGYKKVNYDMIGVTMREVDNVSA